MPSLPIRSAPRGLPRGNLAALAFAACLCASTATAADHDVDLVAGVAPVVRTDLLLSPLRYTGVLPSFGLMWTGRGRRASNRAGLDLALGGLRSGPDWTFLKEGETVETGPTGSTLVDLRYAHGRTVVDGKWQLQLGGSFTAHLEQHGYGYAFTGVSNYLGALSLSPWVETTVALGRHHLGAEAWVPLLTWVARSPYAVQDDAYIWHNRDTNPVLITARYLGAGALASPLAYQSVHLRASWSFDLSGHLGLLLAGRVDFLHLTRPASLAESQLGLDAGLRGSF